MPQYSLVNTSLSTNRCLTTKPLKDQIPVTCPASSLSKTKDWESTFLKER